MTLPLVRNPSDQLALDRGCSFDAEAGERPITFIERFCRQSQGRWGGKPLLLLDWQKDFLRRLFGWKNPDGTRRFRRAYLEVAKKNGKSTLLSAVVLYLLLADGESAPKVFLNACDKEQASIIFDESASMVNASPDLKRRLEVVDSRKRIVWPAGNGRIVANSAEAPNKDGANASAVVFDELHRQRDRSLWDMFEYAGVSREQPLKISITTAGEDENGVWHEQREYSERVNSGLIPDITHLGVIYRAEETDDLDLPATWEKANPSLGATLKPEDFAREYAEAKENPVKFALFKRLRLNIITKTEARFVTPEQWKACGSEPLREADVAGQPCWIGYDGAENTDLAALVTIFGNEDDGIDILVKFWMAEERVRALEQSDRVPYRAWIAQGFIETVDGDLIGTRAPRKEVIRQRDLFDIRQMFLDPWKAREFGAYLASEDGIPCMELVQGIGHLAEPTAKLQALVIGKKLRHGNNPVLKWMAGNAVALSDPNNNIKLNKAKSRQRIDGMAALVNAVAAMSSDGDSGPSVLESRDLIVLG